MARAMGTNAYGKEPRRGERTLSRGFTHRRARRAFLRPYGAGASLGRSHRAYALGYFLVPLTGLRTAHKIGEIFGVRVTKKLKGKLNTTLERIEHGHHIFRAYFKHAFVKQYDPLRLCQETVWK